METTAIRLKKALEVRNLRQIDIVESTGINKGALSSYISGKYEPKQTNIYLLAKALNVNEAWLMGYDVPMERISFINEPTTKKLTDFHTFIHDYMNYESVYRTDSPSVDITLKQNPNKVYNIPVEIYDDFMDEIPEYIQNEFNKILKYAKVIENNYQIKQDNSEYLQPVAAHNDFADEEEEQRLMREDLEDL